RLPRKVGGGSIEPAGPIHSVVVGVSRHRNPVHGCGTDDQAPEGNHVLHVANVMGEGRAIIVWSGDSSEALAIDGLPVDMLAASGLLIGGVARPGRRRGIVHALGILNDDMTRVAAEICSVAPSVDVGGIYGQTEPIARARGVNVRN